MQYYLHVENRTHTLSIPSDYNVQSHLGHVIRPTSPISTRTSLHFDSIPRSNSTNNSISSKAYRRPMTPRVGIRTSVFGAIEVRASNF